MKTIFGIKGFALSEYAISANANLGIRDSGKTYTATEAGEELYDAGVPWLALDPIGVWHSLRIPGKGKGYPVVVAGGRHGDLPLSVKNCGAIVRAAMEAGVSLVIDLFSPDLSKADWRRIVRETVEILLHENSDHGLRHIFIEEAAEFVPQRPRDMQVFDAVERLVRMGGNSKLGCTLINQRSADLNKSVLELCANVFVHRQKGKNTLLDLKKWFTLLDLTPAEEKEIAESLPNLKSGQCWALINDLPKPILLKVPQKNSQHPDRRAANVTADNKRKPVPADAFVDAMKAKLAPKRPEPRAALAGALDAALGEVGRASPSKPVEKINTAGLKAQQRELVAARAEGADAVRMGIPALLDAQHAESFEMGYRHAAIAATEMLQGMRDAFPEPRPGRKRLKDFHRLMQAQVPNIATSAPAGPSRAASAAPAQEARPSADGHAPGLAKAELAILKVLAHFPDAGASKAKVAVWAGYSASSGSFRNSLSSLRTAGLLFPGEPLRPTARGVAAAGDLEPLPSGEALLSYWKAHRALGKAEQTILGVIVSNGVWEGVSLSKEEVARLSGYEVTSGSFRNALSRLRTLDLIKGSGELRGAEEFA